MPPPSQLSIATSSVQRLVKEEASYHKELEKQQARLKNLETNPDGDENAEFQLRQEVLYFLYLYLVNSCSSILPHPLVLRSLPLFVAVALYVPLPLALPSSPKVFDLYLGSPPVPVHLFSSPLPQVPR
jgi:hypothetical protein